MTNDLQIIHNEEQTRFEVTVDDSLAFAEYKRSGNNIIFTHTEVPAELEGRGIGSQLAFTALEYVREQGLKAQALCPFIKAYVTKHPEYHSITWGF